MREQQQWVLGTIFYIQGSSYRKPGAMMLFGDLGEQYGLLSGGCLESDLMRHARQVMDNLQPKIITYDMTDEDDIGWQLGIGCGGLVKILLQPLTKENNYLELETVVTALKGRQVVWYTQEITENALNNNVYAKPEALTAEHPTSAEYVEQLDANKPQYSAKGLLAEAMDNTSSSWLFTPIFPSPHIMIFGGGIDAQPLVDMAHTMGWTITLIDKRPAYARSAHFSKVDQILKVPALTLLENQKLLQSVDGIIIMTHNIVMDGEALKVAQASSASYVGLLGPIHRRERILKQQQLSLAQLNKPLSSPIGLDIGGQLPESIALSILSECHESLYK